MNGINASTAMEYITRKDAKAAGLAKYFVGSECKNGHVAQRRTGSGTCTACEAQTAANWRAKNPELSKQIVLASRKRNPSKVKAWNDSWVARNREHRREYMRRAYRENEAVRSLMHMHARLRDAAKTAAMPKWLTKEDRQTMTAIYTESRRLTKATGVVHHVDHIVPLRGKNVCGLHVPWNLQIIPANDNLKKGNKFEGEVCEA